MAQLAGWNHRKYKIINGSTSGLQTDYQMKLIVHKGTGTDTSTDIYLGTNVRNDFGDVRFTASDGSTLLNYWIESYTSGSVATIWIKIPSIPASPSSVTIYVYYDNPIATTLSNAYATFIGYGDFNTDEGFTWIDQGVQESFGNSTGQLRSNNGRAEFVGASGAGINDVYKSISPTYNFYYETKVSYTSGEGNFEVLGISDSTATPYPATTKSIFAFIDTYHTHLTVYINANNGSGGNTYGSPPAYIAGGSWTYWLVLTRIGTLVTLKIYSDQAKTVLLSQTSLTLTSGYDNSFTYIHPMWWDYNSYSITGYVDDVILRKYASPEPTFGASGTDELNVTATAMTLDKTSCAGPCTINAYVTWHNYGNTDITSFTTAVLVDGTTLAYGAPISIPAGGETSSGAITTPTLSIGSHTICPYPN